MSMSFTSFNKGFGLENSHAFECFETEWLYSMTTKPKTMVQKQMAAFQSGSTGSTVHSSILWWLCLLIAQSALSCLWMSFGTLKIRVDWLIYWQLGGRLVNRAYFNVTRILCRYRCVANIPVNHTETHPVGGHSKSSISWTNVLHACRMEQGQWSN